MPLTRRALLTGAAAVAVAGCHARPRARSGRPDAADRAAVAAAVAAERALLAAVDAAVAAGGPGAAGPAATRAEHEAHLTALLAAAAAPSGGPPSAAASGDPRLLARDGLPSLSAAAVAAHAGPVAAVLAAVAASHTGELTPATTPIVVLPAGGIVGDEDETAPRTTPAQLRARAGLEAALAVEHQAVYGYGLAGARLTGRPRRLALVALDAHETRRDELASLVASTGPGPSPAAPAYLPPFPVTTTGAALRLAARLEAATAAAAWDLAVATGPGAPGRRLAVAALRDAAARSAQWRALGRLGGGPALPGRPGQRL